MEHGRQQWRGRISKDGAELDARQPLLLQETQGRAGDVGRGRKEEGRVY